MAAVYGVNFTKTTNTPRDMIDAREWHGRLRVQSDTYEASALASGSTISVAKLPEGAKFIGFTIHHDALGTGVTLALGDSGDTDRYMAAVAAASAGILDDRANAAIGGVGHVMTAETDIDILTGGASATGTIISQIYYTVD